MTATYLYLPVVYARKNKPITMPDTVYLTVAPSQNKGVMAELIVSPEYLPRGERILIIDAFPERKSKRPQSSHHIRYR